MVFCQAAPQAFVPMSGNITFCPMVFCKAAPQAFVPMSGNPSEAQSAFPLPPVRSLKTRKKEI
jgi:hypothetical protein